MKVSDFKISTKKFKALTTGFTLVELLVVMSIISIMASVVIVSLQSARDKGRVASGIQQDSSIYQRWGTELLGWWKMESIDTVGGVKCTKNEVTGVCDLLKNYAYGEYPYTDNSISITNGVNGGNAFYFLSSGYGYPYIKILGNNGTGILSDFTYSAWVYNMSNSYPAHSIFDYYWQLENQALCYYSNYITPQLPSYFRCTDPGTVPNNKWVFLVTSFNGSSSPNATLRFYIDGKASIPTSGAYTGLSGTGDNVTHISGYEDSINKRQFEGYMDDVRIYKGAMGVAQIEKLYAEGLAKHNLATTVK